MMEQKAATCFKQTTKTKATRKTTTGMFLFLFRFKIKIKQQHVVERFVSDDPQGVWNTCMPRMLEERWIGVSFEWFGIRENLVAKLKHSMAGWCLYLHIPPFNYTVL